VELVERELPGEAGTKRGGAEPLGEHTYGRCAAGNRNPPTVCGRSGPSSRHCGNMRV